MTFFFVLKSCPNQKNFPTRVKKIHPLKWREQVDRIRKTGDEQSRDK